MSLISRFRRKPDGRPNGKQQDVVDQLAVAKIPATDELHYCRVLQIPCEGERVPAQAAIAAAWKMLEEQMTLVPEGEVSLLSTDPGTLDTGIHDVPTEFAWVQSLYFDRCCVTNAEFEQFVAEGGYAQEHLWPPEILAHVLQFVDQSGCAGPRFWKNGQPESTVQDHPVTGICWYEANAYAHWRGKRLPTPEEWQRAATWAAGQSGPSVQTRYPWGDSYDPTRCNTWNSGIKSTTPVSDYYSGCTPNGVYQLIGNVWEWTAALYESEVSAEGDRLLSDVPLAEIRGGAFDTYFASQATSLFRTGQNLLHRGRNLGFRCIVDADQLLPQTDPYAFFEENGES